MKGAPAILRCATMADVPALEQLIATSVRGLNAGHYTPVQLDAALAEVFGVDAQLIADSTYYVIDGPSGPAAAGGWSGRRTLYGGDKLKVAEDLRLDPLTEPARIRAFFVHPDWARRGLARRLYAECERAARAAGFRRFELMATLPGEPLYVALGFSSVERLVTSVAGIDVPFTRMTCLLTGTEEATAAITTKSLTLVSNTLSAIRAIIARMDAAQRTEVSPDWLARLDSGTADAWTLGFSVVHLNTDATVGSCGFKGPPSADGMVEIAYGIAPEYQGNGYATEAAGGMVAWAFSSGQVRVIRAHTMSNENASARVLVKCGFRSVGQIIDPEDGWVWRWEMYRAP